jgi:hypothetical protein
MRSTKIDTENNIEVAEEMTNTRSCDDLTIFCARSFEQIEAIRPIWEKMQSQESHPQLDADINRYLSVVKSLGSDVQPYVIVVYQNDTPKAMLIGRVEKKQVPCKIGYYVIFNPWMHCLNIVYGGIIGELTDTFCVALVQKLMEILARREVDVVYVNRLAMDSPLYRHVMKMPNLLCRTRMPKIEQHWIMDVPGDIDSLYKSFVPKTRNTLKRKNRKLEREFKDQLEFITYNDKNEL